MYYHYLSLIASNNIQQHHPRRYIALASAVSVMLPCIAWHVKVSQCLPQIMQSIFPVRVRTSPSIKTPWIKGVFSGKPAKDWSRLLTTVMEYLHVFAFYIFPAVQDSAYFTYIYIIIYIYMIQVRQAPPPPPQCNVPHPDPLPPRGCGMWLFLWLKVPPPHAVGGSSPLVSS